MELLDRYVYDVGRRLPAKQREDIEKELKSLLLDALEARTGGAEPTEEDVLAVLKQSGSPTKVAASYSGEKYLVGPLLYPGYRLVLGIVLAALAFGLFMSFFVGFIFEPQAAGAEFANRFLQFLGSLLTSVWGAIGVVTVIFWAIGRAMEKYVGELEWEKWDPKKLPPVPKHKNPWKPSDSIAAIVFTIIALILFNAFPEIIAVYIQGNGEQWQQTPILSPEALRAYLPLWDIGWVLSLVPHCMLLSQGRWRTSTYLMHIAIAIYGIVVVGIMMAGPALLNPAVWQGTGVAETLHGAIPILDLQFRWVFIVILAAMVFDIGQSIYRMIKEKT